MSKVEVEWVKARTALLKDIPHWSFFSLPGYTRVFMKLPPEGSSPCTMVLDIEKTNPIPQPMQELEQVCPLDVVITANPSPAISPSLGDG